MAPWQKLPPNRQENAPPSRPEAERRVVDVVSEHIDRDHAGEILEDEGVPPLDLTGLRLSVGVAA
jgi:hypothetical protein